MDRIMNTQLPEVQAQRDKQAREMMEFFNEACRLKITPRRAAQLAISGWRHNLPRTDAESLRRRVARLIRYSRSPIPCYLPCGQDDYAAECRSDAAQEARQLATMIKHARKTTRITS